MAMTGWQLTNLYKNGIIDYVPYELCYEPFTPNLTPMSNPYANGIGGMDVNISSPMNGLQNNLSQYSAYGNSNAEIGNNYFNSATSGLGYKYNENDSFASSNQMYGTANNSGNVYYQPENSNNEFRNFFRGRRWKNSSRVSDNMNGCQNVSEINAMKNSVSVSDDSHSGSKMSNPAVLKGLAGFGILVLLTVMGIKGGKKIVKKIFKKT